METPEVLTPSEVADILKCSKGHVVSLIKSGRLKGTNLGTGKKAVFRVRFEWVEEFLLGQIPSTAKVVRKKKIPQMF